MREAWLELIRLVLVSASDRCFESPSVQSLCFLPTKSICPFTFQNWIELIDSNMPDKCFIPNCCTSYKPRKSETKTFVGLTLFGVPKDQQQFRAVDSHARNWVLVVLQLKNQWEKGLSGWVTIHKSLPTMGHNCEGLSIARWRTRILVEPGTWRTTFK